MRFWSPDHLSKLNPLLLRSCRASLISFCSSAAASSQSLKVITLVASSRLLLGLRVRVELTRIRALSKTPNPDILHFY